jgi:Secretion system C-terminal sorting domain
MGVGLAATPLYAKIMRVLMLKKNNKKNNIYLFIIIHLIICSCISAQVFSGDLTLSSQDEVDSFQYSLIEGSLHIEGNDIVNLDALASLNSIDSNLTIRKNRYLKNVDGLQNLSSVGGSLDIHWNYNVKNIDSLQSLDSLGGDLLLYSTGLIDVNGLKNIKRIYGDLLIIDNDELLNLDGLNNIESVTGDLEIIQNEFLENLQGLSSNNHVGGDIWIMSNASILNLDGFQNISQLSKNFRIYYNSSINSLYGLENLTSVNGGLLITGNPKIADIRGLRNISTVGDLFISQCYILPNLEGLNNLSNVRNSIDINTNTKLKNLDGLSNLAFVGTSLKVTNNDSLKSFCGLYSLLSSEGLNGQFTIQNNYLNSTQPEIINDGPCDTTVYVDSKKNNLHYNYEINQNYPNPFNPSTSISYTIGDQNHIKIIVYNSLGKEIEVLVNETQSSGNYNINFDAEELSSGIYFYSLYIGSKYTQSKKMVLIK